MISFFLILSFFPPSVNCPLLPSPIHSLSHCMQTTIPLFFFLLYFPEHSLTTHKGPCLADRSCNYLLVLTRVQRSEISISNNNGVRDAGSCMLGIWQVSRLLEPTWGEGNPHRGLCPREGGRGHFCFVRGKSQHVPYACWVEDDQLDVLQYSSCKSCLYSHSFWCTHEPKASRTLFLLQLPSCLQNSNFFFHLQSVKKPQENRSSNHVRKYLLDC